MVAMDLGHGDGHGLYVTQVYGLLGKGSFSSLVQQRNVMQRLFKNYTNYASLKKLAQFPNGSNRM